MLLAAASALLLAACDDDTPAADDIEIITPDAASAGATADPPGDDTITLEAVTPAPLPGGDDPYCVAVIGAVTDYNLALQTYIDDVLASTTQAALTNDMTGINELGSTVNQLGLEASEAMDEALELADNKAAEAGITGMIEYLEVYLAPVAVSMVAASDYAAFNDDVTAITQAQMPVIMAQSGHAAAVEAYTYERCGVELKVLTAG